MCCLHLRPSGIAFQACGKWLCFRLRLDVLQCGHIHECPSAQSCVTFTAQCTLLADVPEGQAQGGKLTAMMCVTQGLFNNIDRAGKGFLVFKVMILSLWRIQSAAHARALCVCWANARSRKDNTQVYVLPTVGATHITQLAHLLLEHQGKSLSVPMQLHVNFASYSSYYVSLRAISLAPKLVRIQDFVRMMYPNATESNVRQLMSMARDQKATYKVVSPRCHPALHPWL